VIKKDARVYYALAVLNANLVSALLDFVLGKKIAKLVQFPPSKNVTQYIAQ
jgi:hypothetical protein